MIRRPAFYKGIDIFTNLEVGIWLFKKREHVLAELGVNGFKPYGGEHNKYAIVCL